MARRGKGKKTATGTKRHPWEPLESDLRTVALGHLYPDQRKVEEYKSAAARLDVSLCKMGSSFLHTYDVRNSHDGGKEMASIWNVRMRESGFEDWDQCRPFFPWGYTAFIFCGFSFLRRNQRRAMELDFDVDSGVPMSIDYWESTEAHFALHCAIENLPAAMRDAVKGKHLEGLSAKKVAAKLGTTAAIIHQRCHAGRKKLAKALRGFDPRV